MIGLSGLPAVRLGIGWETLCHGHDVGLFAGRSISGEIARLLDSHMRLVVVCRIVVVWPDRFSNAPVRHGELGIEFSRTLEGTRCFVMIEGVDQPQPLIEKFLCLGIAGRDRMVQGSQP